MSLDSSSCGSKQQWTSALHIFEVNRGLHLSFISVVCSSHVSPHFPYIQSSCVFCLCSYHLWYNQLYCCPMNQSWMKIKAHLLPLSFWTEHWRTGQYMCVCVFTAGAWVCARSQRCIWPLIPGQRSSTLPHLPFFPWLVSTAQCESKRHRTGQKTARYLHQTPLMRKVKVVTEAQ